MKESLSIQSIFEQENDHYTENALLYQDILQYPIQSGKTEFKFRELGMWLLKKNSEFVKAYASLQGKTNYSSRFNAKRDRIEGKLFDLIKVKLVCQVGTVKAEKMELKIPLYALTNNGNFVGLILERKSPKKHAKINQVLYNFIIDWLHCFNSSETKFALSVYERYNHDQLLDVPFDIITDHVCDKIRWLLDLLSIFTYTPPTDNKYRDQHWRIIFETLNMVDSSVRKAVLLHFKQALEHEIIKTYPDIAWEQIWIKNINNEDILTMRGKCANCNNVHNVLIPTMIYLENIFVKDRHPPMKCNNCGSVFMVGTEL